MAFPQSVYIQWAINNNKCLPWEEWYEKYLHEKKEKKEVQAIIKELQENYACEKNTKLFVVSQESIDDKHFLDAIETVIDTRRSSEFYLEMVQALKQCRIDLVATIGNEVMQQMK